MIAGTRVFVSDLPAYRALTAGGAAMLVPPGDPEARYPEIHKRTAGSRS